MDAFIKAHIAYELDFQAEVFLYDPTEQDPNPRIILFSNLVENQLELKGVQNSFYHAALLWIDFPQGIQEVLWPIDGRIRVLRLCFLGQFPELMSLQDLANLTNID